MGSLGRKLARRQERDQAKKYADPKALAKQIQSLPQALEMLQSISFQLEKAQEAVIRMLREREEMWLELQKQRAVSLRLHLNGRQDSDVIQEAIDKENTIREEYDATFALMGAFVGRNESEETQQAAEE